MQAHFHGLIQRALGLHHADGRVGRDLARHRHRLVHHFVQRHDLVNEAELLGLLRVPTAPGEYQFLRHLITNQARQPLARATPREEAMRHFGQRKDRIVGSNQNVTLQRHLITARHAIALDGGDHRLADGGNVAGRFSHQIVPVMHHLLGRFRRALLQIRARAKGLVTSAGNNNHLYILAHIQRGEQRHQLLAHGPVDGVHGFRTIERNNSNTVFDSKQECGFGGHEWGALLES